MKTMLGFIAVAVGWYLVLWQAVVGIDRAHCRAHGAEFSHTTLIGLKGYCCVDGVKVPAEDVGAEQVTLATKCR